MEPSGTFHNILQRVLKDASLSQRDHFLDGNNGLIITKFYKPQEQKQERRQKNASREKRRREQENADKRSKRQAKDALYQRQQRQQSAPLTYPDEMKALLQGTDAEGRNFHENIRSYNSALVFASMGAQIDLSPG